MLLQLQAIGTLSDLSLTKSRADSPPPFPPQPARPRRSTPCSGDIPAPKRCRLRSESTEMVTGRRNEHKATGVFSFMQDTCIGTFTEPFIIA